MHVVILSAGFGTRLYPLTKVIPKALLPIKGTPIMEYILSKLKNLDIKKTVIVTNEKYYPQFFKWVSNYRPHHPLTLISDGTKTESDKLGAIGDLKFAIEKENIKDDILLLVSDMIFSFSLNGFLSTAKKREQNWILLYKLKDIARASNYGVVSLDGDNSVIRFEEKPKNPFSPYVAFGGYYLPGAKLNMIDKFFKDTASCVKNRGDALGGYFQWLVKKKSLLGYVQSSGEWIDIGSSKEQYKKIEKTVKARRMF
ncbi:MAG: nucleotidyltransferase family protein [Candidatus Saelkia tenebricola]|nr:nucleotidyltransferase family protein [Candidatus Saelkia tenebricola]